MKKRIGGVIVISAALIMASLAWGQSQEQPAPAQPSAQASKAGNSPARAIAIPSSALNTMLKTTVGDTRVDEALRVVNAGSGHYGVYILTEEPRKVEPTTGPLRGQFHDQVGEIYHVVSGAGTFLVGSGVDPATKTSRMSVLTGPGGNGVIQEPQLLKYEAGTIIIIPPGIPHNATHEVTERTNFIIYRIDPEKFLELQ